MKNPFSLFSSEFHIVAPLSTFHVKSITIAKSLVDFMALLSWGQNLGSKPLLVGEVFLFVCLFVWVRGSLGRGRQWCQCCECRSCGEKDFFKEDEYTLYKDLPMAWLPGNNFQAAI